jgi:hypothetical protein
MSLSHFRDVLNSSCERGTCYKRLYCESKEWFAKGILQSIQIYKKDQEIETVLGIQKDCSDTQPYLYNLRLLTTVGKSYPFHPPLFRVTSNLVVYNYVFTMIDLQIGPDLTSIVKSFLDFTITMELKKFLYRCHENQGTQNGIQMIQDYEKTLARNCWSPARRLTSQWELIESLLIPLGFRLNIPTVKS